MTECLNQQCHAPSDLYLCPPCITQLADMLDQIPWLLDELDARIQRLDRISIGTIGRQRRPDEINAIDFTAAETARKIRKTLVKWVERVAEQHTGRKPPGLATIATRNLAKWLEVNTTAIARLPLAGQLYADINRMVGSTEDGGQLVKAINRTETAYYGPCTNVAGKNRDGTPRECGHDLYAPRDAIELACPACKTTLNPRRQLTITLTRRDLVTEPKLLEILATLGEPISRVRLYDWLKTGRLKPRGYIHAGRVVTYRVRRGDPRLLSIAEARKLRENDLASTQ